eukprot:648006-Hanusia_phi.AAC.1
MERMSRTSNEVGRRREGRGGYMGQGVGDTTDFLHVVLDEVLLSQRDQILVSVRVSSVLSPSLLYACNSSLVPSPDADGCQSHA